MAPPAAVGQPEPGVVYRSVYNNVPVLEVIVNGEHVMRRECDDRINATHLLKIAGLDKPARTRVLEKEIHQGEHEKVQGGYGRFQGTWVPLARAIEIARTYGVYETVQPLLEYTRGGPTPPPVPRMSAAARRVRAPRGSAATSVPPPAQPPAAPRPAPPPPAIQPTQSQTQNETEYENDADDDEADDDMEEFSLLSTEETVHRSVAPHKAHFAEIVPGSQLAYQHYFGEALDSFVTHDLSGFPPLPAGFPINGMTDHEGHTLLSWACATGDYNVVDLLLNSGADPMIANARGETPLIRMCLFSNGYDRNTFEAILDRISDTITMQDKFGATCLHHTVKSVRGEVKEARAEVYLTELLRALRQRLDGRDFQTVLDAKDGVGDTALHIAARRSQKCYAHLRDAGASDDQANESGEMPRDIINLREKLSDDDYLTGAWSRSDPSAALRDVPSHFKAGQFTHRTTRDMLQTLQTSMESSAWMLGINIDKSLEEKDELLEDVRVALRRLGDEKALLIERMRNPLEYIALHPHSEFRDSHGRHVPVRDLDTDLHAQARSLLLDESNWHLDQIFHEHAQEMTATQQANRDAAVLEWQRFVDVYQPRLIAHHQHVLAARRSQHPETGHLTNGIPPAGSMFAFSPSSASINGHNSVRRQHSGTSLDGAMDGVNGAGVVVNGEPLSFDDHATLVTLVQEQESRRHELLAQIVAAQADVGMTPEGKQLRELFNRLEWKDTSILEQIDGLMQDEGLITTMA